MSKVKFIPIEKLLEFKANEVAFKLVEVLSSKLYDQGHIPDAINIPVEDLKEKAPEQLDKEENIIVYCGGYQCKSSTKAARILQNLGYKNVFDYKAGKRGWVEARFKLKKEEK